MPALLLFFDISAGELVIILLVAFLVFGPSKIPEIARKVGRGMNEIRRASDEIKREITKETRKVEKEMHVEGSVFNDIKKSSEEIKKDFQDIARPLDENLDETTGDVPKKTPPDEPAG